jgi:hypothetical protein
VPVEEVRWPGRVFGATKLRQVRDERAEIQSQLAELENTLRVGRDIFLKTLDLLKTPRGLYEQCGVNGIAGTEQAHLRQAQG